MYISLESVSQGGIGGAEIENVPGQGLFGAGQVSNQMKYCTPAVKLTVKDCVEPAHPFSVGVTVIVATVGLFVVLIAVNGAIFPVPLDANPIVELLFVHS